MAIGLWQTCSTNILRVNQKLALAKNIFGGNCNFIVQIDRSRISKISLTENADKLTLGRIVKRVLLIPRTSQSKQFDDHLLANEIVRNAYSFLVIIFGKRLFFLRFDFFSNQKKKKKDLRKEEFQSKIPFNNAAQSKELSVWFVLNWIENWLF